MSTSSTPSAPGTPPVVTCYRHPDRRAGVRCQRCTRPICPSCMSQASVGFHCPECVRDAKRRAPSYTARTLPGSRPIVTLALVAVNVAVFAGQVATIGRGDNVVWGMSGEVGDQAAMFGPAVAAGEWWRLLTNGFAHFGLAHLAMNMFVLYMIGPQIERLLGPLRFAGLYVAALLAGALGVMALSPVSVTAGASGAIFGLLGAAAAFQLANRINIWQSGLGGLILLNLAITFAFSSFVSVGGHVGGLAGGALVGWVQFQLDKQQAPPLVGFAVSVAAAVGFAVVAISIAPTSLPGYLP